MPQIHIPDIGDFHDVEVIDVLVKAGDTVAVDTPLITLETEKATMDVPSTAAGVVESLAVKKGDRVSKGALVLTLAAGDAAAAGDRRPATGDSQKDAGSAARGLQPAAPTASPQVSGAAGQGSSEPAASKAVVDVVVPDIGDFQDVEIIEVLVKTGDTVAVDSPLITLETEKATMDVPSTAAGVVESLAVKKGDRVSKGALVLTLAAADAAAAAAGDRRQATGDSQKDSGSAAGSLQSAAPTASLPVSGAAGQGSSEPAAGRPQPVASNAAIDESAFTKAHAGPSVRRLARELGVDLGRVRGSGVKGRITHDDVKAWVKQVLSGGAAGGSALPSVPVVDFAKFGPVEAKPLGRIQKISGPRLHASWVNIPHVTQYDEADITDLEAERVRLKDDAAKNGVKLTPLAFILRAVARTLQAYPVFNTSLDAAGQNLVFKQYIHLGFAADTPNGLVVPVIRDADRKDVYELARELAVLSEKARSGKLSGAEMQGGTFTVSSLGGIGGTAFTPIINAPEVAILGVSRSGHKPVWRDGSFVPRLMLPLSLSYDHRVIDGAAGARFAVHLAQQLADVKGLLMAVP